jgi:hypothetical protein
MAGFGPAVQQQARGTTTMGTAGGESNEPADLRDDVAEEQPNVSEDEQAAYDQFVGNALMLIYDEKSMPSVVKMLEGNGNPKEGLAGAAVSIVQRLHESATNAGREIPGDVMLHGGLQIVEELAELQADAGIAKLAAGEVEGAYYRALDMYREHLQKTGAIDQQALEQDMVTMANADKAGRLDEVVPGASEAAARYQQQGGQ